MRVQFLAGCVWVMAAAAAFAETPIPGGLPPLPPQTKMEQLERERDLLRQEAKELGEGETIAESIVTVQGSIYEHQILIQRLEEAFDAAGISADEIRTMQQGIANAQGFDLPDLAEGQAKDKVKEKVIERGVSRLWGRLFSLYSLADTVVDLGRRAERWRLKRAIVSNLEDSLRQQRAGLSSLGQTLIALYGDLVLERNRLTRLQEIDRRDGEIFREIVAERERTASRNANLRRVDDTEYDELVLDIDRMHTEIEQVRFRLRLAEMEGRRADAELLRQRLAGLERQVEALERRADEMEETPRTLGGVSYGCSAGLFYIPGTETCLAIGGYVRTSFLEHPYSPGIGTIRAGGNERLAFSFGDDIQRWGGGLSFEYGLSGSGSFFGLPAAPNYSFMFGEAEGAWGSASSEGSYTVGSGEVEAVAATLLREDAIFGTGWIASAPGFGLTGAAEVSNSWAVGWMGMGHTFPLRSDAGGAAALMVKGGPFVEGIRFDSSGRVDLTFDGSPFGGYYQAYELETRDLYLGLKAEAAYVWQPSPPWQLSLSANLSLGYHEAQGRIGQETSFGGSLVQQGEDYRRDSLFAGVGIGAGIKWRPWENLSLESAIALDYVPDVTGYRMPANPDEQPGGFSGRDVWRINISLLKVTAAF